MNFILPIFLFGCTISGVVILGVIEAIELAKRSDLADQNKVSGARNDLESEGGPDARSGKISHE